MAATQPEREIVLPIGYVDESGRAYRRARIRKMRGHEEALLYDTALTGGQLVTELIRSCLIRLGELPTIDSGVVTRLYTADRNYLLMEIRRFTLGDRLQARYACPHCGEAATVVEDLAQVEVRRLGDDDRVADVSVTLEDGYTDRAGKTHKDLTLSLPCGADEEFVSPMVDRDPLKAQEALLLRCIKRFGTLSRAVVEAYGVKILRELTLGDRRRLQDALAGDQAPGMNLRRSVQCGPCGARFEGVMDMSHFFVLG
jgi:hypothetical protein